MGDCLIGLVGADYVLIAAETNQGRSIVRMKSDEDKIYPLDKHKMIGASGPSGDRAQFIEYIKRNIILYELRQNIPLSTSAAANFTREELASALRQNPYQVNLLLGGFDDKEGASLYFMDYLAALHKMDFACQGYAGYFLLGLLDKIYQKGMNLDDGMKVMHACIQQMQTRFALNVSSWIIKIVDKEGVRVVERLGDAQQQQQQ